MLVDLEGGSEMLGDWIFQVLGEVPAGALWSSRIQNWVMIYLKGSCLVPALVLNWKYLCGAPLTAQCLWDPLLMVLQRLALLCLPSLPSLLLGCHSHFCKLAEIALIRGSSLSLFMLHFPGSASTTEISRQGG